MVKLGIIGDEISQDLGIVLDLVRSHGFDGIEIRSVWNTRPHELSTEQCRRIREELGAVDVELVAYDSPAFKHALPLTTSEYDASARLFERSIEIARALGSPPTRVFSFYRDGLPQVEAAAEAMAKLFDRVSCGDVPLLVENGTRTNSPTACTLAELLGLLAPRPLGALWDPGNAAFCGLEATPPLEAYRILGKSLRLVHVKDPRDSHSYTRVGDGDVPWTSIITKLAAERFVGFLSLETHWRLGRVLSQVERDQPWGHSFSFDGHEPSSICMALLKDMTTTGLVSAGCSLDASTYLIGKSPHRVCPTG